MKHTLILFLTFCNISAYCQTPQKAFLGTWETTRSDSSAYSVSEEKWEFQNLKTGVWNRKLILNKGAIICLLKNPFTWEITSRNKLRMILGETDCQCTASEKKFEVGLDDFANKLKAIHNGELSLYHIKSVDSKTIALDDFNLTRE